MPQELFVLDADVFIQSHRQYYAFDIAPGFWRYMEEHGASGRVRSIDRVRDELRRGRDTLAEWARGHGALFASTAEPEVVRVFRWLVDWAQQQGFSTSAQAAFGSAADGWLVAYASASGCVVVSQEQRVPGEVKTRIKVPNVCAALNVPCIGTFEMLRRLHVRLSRSPDTG